MHIYAHKGYSSAFPENTISSFQGALDLGVYGVELDIHLSADGIPVVIHDERLERTTDGTGFVRDKTAAELAELDAGNCQGVPTFEEVVALANGRLHFDIEIKGQHCEEAVLGVLARHAETRGAISSFDWDVLANVRRLASEFELWVLTHTISDEAIDIAEKLGTTTLAVEHIAISKTSMARSANAGLQVMAWTVNSQSEADRLRDLGVVALCTDDPSTVR
jgi:glycerophosphoryl diester phosphodiesterase